MKKSKILGGVCMLALVAGLGMSLAGCGEPNLTHKEAVLPTCDTAGTVEYWEDAKTGKKYADEKGKTELSDVAVPALGHDYEYTYDSTEFKYDGVCSRDAHHTDTVYAGTNQTFAYQVGDKATLEIVLGEGGSSTIYVKLTENFNADVEIAKGKDVCLDLNGKTLTNEAGHTITNNGKLQIVDNSTERTGKVDNITHAKGAVVNNLGATLVIDGGNYTRSLENGKNDQSSGGNSWYVIANYGTATINDGKIYNNGAFSSLIENGWYTPSQNTTATNSVMTINGGVFEGGLNTIKNDDYGVMTINGGTFQNKMPSSDVESAQSIIMNWNELTIAGGNFVGNDCKYLLLNGFNGDDTYEKATITITGGNVSGTITTNIPYAQSTNPNYENGTVTGIDNFEGTVTTPTPETAE